MTFGISKKTITVILCGSMLCSTFVGCNQTPTVAKLSYFGHQPLTTYKDVVTEIAYPEVAVPESKIDLSLQPRRIYDLSEDTIWNLSLADAIRITLENGAIVKDDGSFGSPGNPVLSNPNGARTAYDIAIQESGILFGNRGVEAALADFDAQLTSTITWGRTDLVQNSPNFVLGSGSTSIQETGAFSTQLQKQFADSSTFTLQGDINYDGSNNPSRAFPSVYNGFARATFRRPLLAGQGPEFTRIAGPIGANLQGVSGVSQGVVISRINTDIAIADFEGAIATMVRDVVNRYWDVYRAYQLYDAESLAGQYAQDYWLGIKKRLNTTDEQKAQALQTYHESVARMENSLVDIHQNEARLRRLMGLPPRDNRGIIRPVDRPSDAILVPDPTITVAEAITRRPEIRSQKWNIRSLELQLKAAKNLTRPRFDFVAQYQLNGFGDNLFRDGDFVPNPLTNDEGGIVNDSFFGSITSANTESWNLGFQLAFPFGFRTAHTQVRNYEFRLRKARKLLSAQESEIQFEIMDALSEVERWQRIIWTNREQLAWARENLKASIEVLDKLGNEDASNVLSRILQAHIRARESQINYNAGLIEYNKALVVLDFRKGATLSENGVHLSEGAWCPSAYQDALRRAWARSYAKDASKHRSSAPLEFNVGRKPQAQADPKRTVGDLPSLTTRPLQPKQPEKKKSLEELENERNQGEDDDQTRPPSLNVPRPEEPEDDRDMFETVRRTGFMKPVARQIQRIRRQPATGQQVPRMRPVQQQYYQAPQQSNGINEQLDTLQRQSRHTGDSKAG